MACKESYSCPFSASLANVPPATKARLHCERSANLDTEGHTYCASRLLAPRWLADSWRSDIARSCCGVYSFRACNLPWVPLGPPTMGCGGIAHGMDDWKSGIPLTASLMMCISAVYCGDANTAWWLHATWPPLVHPQIHLFFRSVTRQGRPAGWVLFSTVSIAAKSLLRPGLLQGLCVARAIRGSGPMVSSSTGGSDQQSR